MFSCNGWTRKKVTEEEGQVKSDRKRFYFLFFCYLNKKNSKTANSAWIFDKSDNLLKKHFKLSFVSVIVLPYCILL